MRKMKRFLALLTTMSILSSVYISVSAMSVISSTFIVSAGGSEYSQQTCFQSTYHSQCYMRMRSFRFNGYSTNVMPNGCHIASRLYLVSKGGNYYPATTVATFTAPTSVGQYNYSFQAGYGGAGQTFIAKTNSTSSLAFNAVIEWKTEPY